MSRLVSTIPTLVTFAAACAPVQIKPEPARLLDSERVVMKNYTVGVPITAKPGEAVIEVREYRVSQYSTGVMRPSVSFEHRSDQGIVIKGSSDEVYPIKGTIDFHGVVCRLLEVGPYGECLLVRPDGSLTPVVYGETGHRIFGEYRVTPTGTRFEEIPTERVEPVEGSDNFELVFKGMAGRAALLFVRDYRPDDLERPITYRELTFDPMSEVHRFRDIEIRLDSLSRESITITVLADDLDANTGAVPRSLSADARAPR